MALIARISPSHSVRDFRRPARLRFAEAERAVDAGDRLIGVYLAGYAAEMTLKATYFQVAGWKSTDPITFQDLQTAKLKAISLGVVWNRGNLHELTRWAEFLIQDRSVAGVPYSRVLSEGLMGQTTRLYRNWRESLRYHGNLPRPSEVVAVFEAVKWLFVNASQLAR